MIIFLESRLSPDMAGEEVGGPAGRQKREERVTGGGWLPEEGGPRRGRRASRAVKANGPWPHSGMPPRRPSRCVNIAMSLQDVCIRRVDEWTNGPGQHHSRQTCIDDPQTSPSTRSKPSSVCILSSRSGLMLRLRLRQLPASLLCGLGLREMYRPPSLPLSLLLRLRLLDRERLGLLSLLRLLLRLRSLPPALLPLHCLRRPPPPSTESSSLPSSASSSWEARFGRPSVSSRTFRAVSRGRMMSQTRSSWRSWSMNSSK